MDIPCGTDLNSLALLSPAHTAVSATQKVKLLSIFGPVRVFKFLTDGISTPSLHRLASIPRGHECRSFALQRCTSKTPPINCFYAIHFRPIWGINLFFSLSLLWFRLETNHLYHQYGISKKRESPLCSFVSWRVLNGESRRLILLEDDSRWTLWKTGCNREEVSARSSPQFSL